MYRTLCMYSRQGGRSCATARPPVSASAGAPALAGSPSIRAFVAKSVLTRITRYWIHYFQLFSATSTVKMPVFMKNYKFCWQNCKKNDVYVAKICNGKIRCFCRENLQTRALRQHCQGYLVVSASAPTSATCRPVPPSIIVLQDLSPVELLRIL